MKRLTLAVSGVLAMTSNGWAQTNVTGTGVTSVGISITSDSGSGSPVSGATGADTVLPMPFKAGETARYDVKFGFMHVGEASAQVAGTETVRGRSVWHTIFHVNGGTLFYHVNDLFESWIDRSTLYSLRFYQTQEEGSKSRIKRYEIYPDKLSVIETDKNPPRQMPGVKDPLDDGSFLFFIRTLPLAVGQSYEFNRYYRPENNPVRIRVVRTERLTVPAGTFDCIVVQPIIKTKGIFSENGHAEVWLTNDARHVVVQMKSQLKFGSINLYLRSYKPGT